MAAVLVTNCDDWEGLYIDGVLVEECHKINFKDWVGKISELTEVEVTSEWLGEDVGSLPSSISDIPKWAIL